jgi:uncharacterized protein YgiM (DUF1202 family)
MVVGGTGVTVRSAPTKAGSKLFALAAGQQVTVTSTQRNWYGITDATGRTGWVYSTYLVKPTK